MKAATTLLPATATAAETGEKTASGPRITTPSNPVAHSPAFRPKTRAIVGFTRSENGPAPSGAVDTQRLSLSLESAASPPA